jgi:ligand-binding sensor domain-containing protein/signal transduction histidine kinase
MSEAIPAARTVARKLANCLFWLLATASSAYALNPNKQISQYAHKVWSSEGGPLYSGAEAITQGADGYLWIGTAAGLFRFDGVRFVRFAGRDENQMGSQAVSALMTARDGSLWIGTDRGLYRWANRHLTNYPLAHGWITSIIQDRIGVVWVGQRVPDGSGSLCRVADNATRCYGQSDGIPTDSGCCDGLAEDANGNLWVAASTMLLRWLPSPQYFPIRGLARIQSGVLGLAASPDGALWVGTALAGSARGLLRLVRDTWVAFRTSSFDGSSLAVKTIFLDHDRALWVGTLDRGLYRISGENVEHFDSHDGLSGDSIARVYEDREGTLWIATTRGLDSFRETAITTFSTKEGLRGSFADSVLASRNGTIWTGTGEDLEALRRDGVSAVGVKAGLPAGQVTSLLEDHNRSLWVGVDDGLWKDDNGRFRRIARPHGQSIGMVTGITEDVEGNIWVEVIGPPRTLIRVRDMRVEEMFAAPQMPAALKVAADPKNGVWLGLLSGDIARYQNGKLDSIPYKNHPAGVVRQLNVDPEGTVLAATDFGLIRWQDGKERVLSARDGLPCDAIYGIVTDNNQNLWLYSQCGLIEISNLELQRWWKDPSNSITLRNFDALDGALPGHADFNPSTKSPDGRLWFANRAQLQMIDPAHLMSNSVPPPVHVERVVVDRKTYWPWADLHLPPLARDIEIDYTATSFVAVQKILFRYQLQGYDKSWQDAGTRRQAFYSNLRPGTYRFQVLACNSDGLWNTTGASIEFSIEPAWYQTRWFVVLCIAASLFGARFLYRLRMRQITHAFRVRFEERLAERTRIARDLHDTLLQATQGVIFKFQAAVDTLPSSDPNHDRLEEALNRADEVLEDSRSKLAGLRGFDSKSQELFAALTVVGQSLAVDRSIKFRSELEGEPRELHPVVREEAYRIGAEALTNSFTHAKATAIELDIRYEAAALRVLVRDDGVGIEQSTLVGSGRAGHFGLLGMRERTAKISARIRILTRPGAGTEVQLRVPATMAYRPPTPDKIHSWVARLFGADRGAE